MKPFSLLPIFFLLAIGGIFPASDASAQTGLNSPVMQYRAGFNQGHMDGYKSGYIDGRQ